MRPKCLCAVYLSHIPFPFFLWISYLFIFFSSWHLFLLRISFRLPPILCKLSTVFFASHSLSIWYHLYLYLHEGEVYWMFFGSGLLYLPLSLLIFLSDNYCISTKVVIKMVLMRILLPLPAPLCLFLLNSNSVFYLSMGRPINLFWEFV